MLKKAVLFCLIFMFFLACFLLISNQVLAQFGLENFDNSSDNSFFSANQSLSGTIIRIINIIVGIIGIIFLVLLIYGGVLYATSAGGEQIDKAKKVLTYAIIGIVVVALSFAITNYVIEGLFTDQSDWSQNNGGGSSGSSGSR